MRTPGGSRAFREFPVDRCKVSTGAQHKGIEMRKAKYTEKFVPVNLSQPVWKGFFTYRLWRVVCRQAPIAELPSDLGLPWAARSVLVALLDRCNDERGNPSCWASMRGLSEATGLNPSDIANRYLPILRDQGYIERQSRGFGRSKRTVVVIDTLHRLDVANCGILGDAYASDLATKPVRPGHGITTIGVARVMLRQASSVPLDLRMSSRARWVWFVVLNLCSDPAVSLSCRISRRGFGVTGLDGRNVLKRYVPELQAAGYLAWTAGVGSAPGTCVLGMEALVRLDVVNCEQRGPRYGGNVGALGAREESSRANARVVAPSARQDVLETGIAILERPVLQEGHGHPVDGGHGHTVGGHSHTPGGGHGHMVGGHSHIKGGQLHPFVASYGSDCGVIVTLEEEEEREEDAHARARRCETFAFDSVVAQTAVPDEADMIMNESGRFDPCAMPAVMTEAAARLEVPLEALGFLPWLFRARFLVCDRTPTKFAALVDGFSTDRAALRVARSDYRAVWSGPGSDDRRLMALALSAPSAFVNELAQVFLALRAREKRDFDTWLRFVGRCVAVPRRYDRARDALDRKRLSRRGELLSPEARIA